MLVVRFIISERYPHFITNISILHTVTNILKFYEVSFCTNFKNSHYAYIPLYMLKPSQHKEMRKNNSKLNFTKNRQVS